jgi:hypothetical protein
MMAKSIYRKADPRTALQSGGAAKKEAKIVELGSSDESEEEMVRSPFSLQQTFAVISRVTSRISQ